MALEHGTVQLDGVASELRVHRPARSQEVLGVPELRLDLGVDVHLLEDGLRLSLSLAVGTASHLGKMLASVKNKEEVVGLFLEVLRGLVLDEGVLAAHIGAPVTINVLPEHLADVVLVPKLVALHRLVVTDGNTVLTLNPKAREVLVLGASHGVVGAKGAHLV